MYMLVIFVLRPPIPPLSNTNTPREIANGYKQEEQILNGQEIIKQGKNIILLQAA